MRHGPEWTPPPLPALRLVRAHPTVWQYGHPQPESFVEEWTSVNLKRQRTCHWCWEQIPPGRAFACIPIGLARHEHCHTEAQSQ